MEKENILEKNIRGGGIESRGEAKWRNVLFDKSGKSHLGVRLWDTREQARTTMTRIEESLKKKSDKGTLSVIPVMEGSLLSSSYVWSMQIPILENI